MWMGRRQINGNRVVHCYWDGKRFAVPLVISSPIGGIKMNWSLLRSLWGGTIYAVFPTGHWKSHAISNRFVIMRAKKHHQFVALVYPGSKASEKIRLPSSQCQQHHPHKYSWHQKICPFVQAIHGILRSGVVNLAPEWCSLGWGCPH